MIPGLIPSPGLMSLEDIKTISHFPLLTSSTRQITIPIWVLPGDLLLSFAYAINNSGTPSSTFPDGFTLVANSSGSNRRYITSYKLADENDQGRTILGPSGSSNASHYCLVIRANRPLKKVSPHGAQFVTTSGNPAPITITSSAGKPPLLVVARYSLGGDGSINPRIFLVDGVDAKDHEASPNDNQYFVYKFFRNNPKDVVIDMDDEGELNTLHGCWLELR